MIATLLGITGCGAAPREPSIFERAALARGRAELACADPDVFVEPLGAGGYRVRGCDAYVTYTCLERFVEGPGPPVPGARGQVVCALSERETPTHGDTTPPDRAPSEATEPRDTWTEAELQAMASSARGAVELCLTADEEISLQLLAGGTGAVRRVNELANPAMTECVDAALARQTLDGHRSRPGRITLRVRGR